MRHEIRKFACELFDSTELKEIYEILSAYADSEKQNELSLMRLRRIIPTRPKRPLYYVNHGVGFLPELSRFVVEQTGSYLDLIVKEFRYEAEGKYHKEPLGMNINALARLIDGGNAELRELLKQLSMFNQVAYVPAKHVYGPPIDDIHYFDVDDTLIIVLAGVKLGEKLKKRSEYVRKLCQDLVLPAQKPYLGEHPRTDTDGAPFNFKDKLIKTKTLL